MVTNLYDGIDWYSVKSRTLTSSTVQRIETNVVIPITFIDNGSGVLLGGSCGHASICDVKTRDTIQELEHDGKLCRFTKRCVLNVDHNSAHEVVKAVVRSAILTRVLITQL